MNTISIKTVCEEMWEKKVYIIIFAIVCALLLGFYGYKKSKNFTKDTKTLEAEENYATELANYEEAIVNATEGVEAARESYAKIKEYNDNSLYMKLNPENVYVASLQYAFSSVWLTNEAGESYQASTVIGDVMQSHILYMNDGDFRSKVVAEYNRLVPDAPLTEDSIRELITNAIVNNIVQVKMFCIDEAMADNMLKAMAKAFEGQKSQIESVQGVFNTEQLVADVYSMANIDVRNYQNARTDELKNNDIALNDQLSRQTAAIKNRDEFIEDNEIETAVSPNPVKELIKWLIFGAILGVALPFAVFFLRYVISGRVKSIDELLAGGLSVACVYKKNVKLRDDRLKQDINGLLLMAAKKNIEELYVWSIAAKDEMDLVMGSINSALNDIADANLSISVIDASCANQDLMKKMADAGCAMLACKLHKNTYEEIERQRQLLKALDIDLMGCVVVE